MVSRQSNHLIYPACGLLGSRNAYLYNEVAEKPIKAYVLEDEIILIEKACADRSLRIRVTTGNYPGMLTQSL